MTRNRRARALTLQMHNAKVSAIGRKAGRFFERQIAVGGYLSPGSFPSIHERKCEFLVDLVRLPPL